MMSTTTFVEQLYSNFLGRNATTAEMTYWEEQLNSGNQNAAEISQFFIDSPEFSELVSPIAQLYYAAFNRIPDASGLLYWINQYQSGADINSISNGFIQSQEFQSTYGDLSQNGDFLEQLFQNVLGRGSDEAGKQYWLGAMENGLTREEVLNGFAHSNEFKLSKIDAIKVILIYHGILNTTPSQEQVDDALSSADLLQLITQLYGSPEYQGEVVPGLATSGVVVDGYVSGATVFIDLDGDGQQGPNEPSTTTDAQGNFDFGSNVGFGRLVMSGGTDISTGKPFEGTMTAPAGSSVVNPLTTIIEAMTQDGTTTAEQAAQNIANGLGLDNSVDLLNYDPIAEASQEGATAEQITTAIAIQAANAQVNTLTSQTAALLNGSGVSSDEAGGIHSAYGALANLFSQNSSNVNLASNSVLQGIIEDAANQAGADNQQLNLIQNLSGDAAQTIANLNNAIDEAAKSGNNPDDILVTIAAVQIVAENVENQMQNGAANGDVSTTISQTSGSNLDNAVNDAGSQVGDVNGDGNSDNTTPTSTGGGGSDTTAPNAPTFDMIASDNIVNSPEATAGFNITGTGEAGATVTLVTGSNTTLLGGNTAVVNSSGVWSIPVIAADVTTMGQGDESLSVTQKDPSGNLSTATSTSINIETVAPTANSTTPYAAMDNDTSGTFSDGDVIRLQFSEPVSASSLTAASISLDNGHTIGTANVAALLPVDGFSKVFTITLANSDATIANGDTLTVSAADVVDQVGNPATADITFNVTTPVVDNTPLNAPSIHLVSADDIINAAESAAGFNITGTGKVGATVNLLVDVIDSTNNSNLVNLAGGNSAVVNGLGVWSIPVIAADIAAMDVFGNMTATGYPVALAALQNDTPFNLSTPTIEEFTVDTAPPTITSVVVNSWGDLEITYDKDISSSIAELGDYHVTVNGTTNHAISKAIVWNGNQVILVSENKILFSDTVDSVAYTAAQGTPNSILNGVGNTAIDQTITAVTNNSIEVPVPYSSHFNNLNNSSASQTGGDNNDNLSMQIYNTNTNPTHPFATNQISGLYARQLGMNGLDTLAMDLTGGAFVSNYVVMMGGGGVDSLSLNYLVAPMSLNKMGGWQSEIVRMEGGTGNDTINMTLDAAASLSGIATMDSNSFTLDGGDGSDEINFHYNMTGVSNSQQVTTNAVSLKGGAGDDTLWLDWNHGYQNSSGIWSNTFSVYGDDGHDSMSLDFWVQGNSSTAISSNSFSMFGGTGNDSINMNIQLTDITANFAKNSMFISGDNGNDTINLNLDLNVSSQNTLAGVASNSFIVLGGQGNDLINVDFAATSTVSGTRTGGFAGNNLAIIGGDGSDSINVSMAAAMGTPNSISLTGGKGADAFTYLTDYTTPLEMNSFIFNYNTIDELGDTASGFDVVSHNLSFKFANAAFNGDANTDGSLDAGHFVSGNGAVALDNDDFWIYDTSVNTLYYDADGTGTANTAQAVMTFTKNISLSSGNLNFF